MLLQDSHNANLTSGLPHRHLGMGERSRLRRAWRNLGCVYLAHSAAMAFQVDGDNDLRRRARQTPLGVRCRAPAMRHTGEWVGTYDALSAHECMKAIQDDSWFVP
jgi:hypothetical protein